MTLRRILALSIVAAVGITPLAVSPASATPVCTDGYKGGPPLASCGGRIFPEAELARSYVQFLPDPAGFEEYAHGIQFLAKTYPRWISVTNLAKHYKTRLAKSVGPDGIRSYEQGDDDDGYDIWVVKITDHKVPDKGKLPLFFSLSVHGNERGGLEGGLRTAEDLAMMAENGGAIVDGIDNYESTTGRKPKFHEYEVKDVLKKEVVYLVDFNPDGWVIGDNYAQPAPRPYGRGNGLGTDLNRQMPTIGRINSSRNPLTESEMIYGHKFMHEVAGKGPSGLMAHAADVHGELNSNAYVDIMYPAGQFDSVDHRRLMAIAERVKSVIDATLFEGIQNEIEEASGGNSGEGPGPGVIPSKPAHWATVWDTLGYTDTGFIGDYMATDLAVTGMDYEFAYNHTVPDKAWNVYMQENHINGARALIETSMAYALYQKKEFNAGNFKIDTKGARVGYVYNRNTVSDRDANGPGTLPGPGEDGIGANGKPVKQKHYNVSNMQWFKDTNKLLPEPFVKLLPADVASRTPRFKKLDTLVLADVPLPRGHKGRRSEDPKSHRVPRKKYYSALLDWVKAGGNLVLTDRAMFALQNMKVVPKNAVKLILVYQPHSDIADFAHPMVQGLRDNARQLVEAAVLGYCIGDVCSPTTVVDQAAFTDAGGHVVGTTDDQGVSVGEIAQGKGVIRVIGGVLPTPTEEFDHRYGLRDYAPTYTGLYILENSMVAPK